MNIQAKINYSIDLIRSAEPIALRLDPDGFHLAFSGGKDSQVMFHLAKMAGVKFHAHMQITTLDPPQLLRFVRTEYPEVQLHRPEINFYQLIIKKKMLPLKHARYCCAYLKEQAGAGSCTLIGIRAEESSRRAKRNEVEISGHKFSGSLDQFNRRSETTIECVGGKDKLMISPIFLWTHQDIWTFIRDQGLKYCELYDQGYSRIGCIFCPMASVKSKVRDRHNFPGVERAIKKSIQTLIEENNYGKDWGATADELFDWWVSNKPTKEFFGMLRSQTKIPFDEL